MSNCGFEFVRSGYYKTIMLKLYIGSARVIGGIHFQVRLQDVISLWTVDFHEKGQLFFYEIKTRDVVSMDIAQRCYVNSSLIFFVKGLAWLMYSVRFS